MGESITIVLNLGILKFELLIPTRLDQNIEGPLEVDLIIMIINNEGIKRIKRTKKEIVTSNNLFKTSPK